MSSSVLETQRSALEELERIEEAISERVLYNPHIMPDTHSLESSSALHGKKKRPLRDDLIHEHEVAKMLDRYEEQCKYLKRSFAKVSKDMDESHPAKLREKEVNELNYEQFQKQVAGIRDFHKRYPNEGVENQEMLFKMTKDRIREEKEMGILSENDEENQRQQGQLQQERLLSAFAVDLNVDSMFSGEEFYGRFMDLVGLHERFLNLKFLNRAFTYLQYLDKFADFNDKSIYGPSRFRDPEYFSYVADLHNYLVSFLKRTHPLEAPENVCRGIDNDFDSAWNSKSLSIQQNGSGDQGAGEGQVAADGSVWCEACAKSFKNEAVYYGHLNGNKHKKNVKVASASGSEGTEDVKLKTLAYHEYCIYHLAEFLAKHVSETRANVERKQALTDRERQLETEALESEVIGSGAMESDSEQNDNGEDEDENDDVVYNPLKLPLGWDGKPIPYWLWKLNGLGIEYPCEICGNHTYMGRKAFEKHFMEARHTHGLKCLGIQPSVLFKNITSIKDAVARKYTQLLCGVVLLTLSFSVGQD